MKHSIYLFVISSMILAPLARADEVSELKAKVKHQEQLLKRAEANQAREVEELKNDRVTGSMVAGATTSAALTAGAAYTGIKTIQFLRGVAQGGRAGAANLVFGAATGAVTAGAGTGAYITGSMARSQFKRAGERLEAAEADLKELQEANSADVINAATPQSPAPVSAADVINAASPLSLSATVE